MNVRPFRAGDAEAVSALIAALNAHEGYDPEAAPGPAALRDTFLGPAARGTILVAEEGGALLGYAALVPHLSLEDGATGQYLADLFVLPERRGAGVGRALIAAAAREAAARDGSYLWWTSLPGNSGARGFYARMGAAEKTLVSHTLEGEAFARLASSGPA